MMKALTIKLSGPLQSYGDEATFNRRTTRREPSKSAIIGMISAALGYERDDPRILKLNSLYFATRTDQQGKLVTDFQNVHSKLQYTYDSKKDKGVNKVTYRDYWADAIFIVGISAKDETIDKIAYALKHPTFQLYMGRRNCPVVSNLEIHTYDNIANPVNILKDLPWQASKWYQKQLKEETYSAKITTDAFLLPELDNELVKDQVGSFDQKHRFMTYRPVATTYVKLENPNFKRESVLKNQTNQDVFATLK